MPCFCRGTTVDRSQAHSEYVLPLDMGRHTCIGTAGEQCCIFWLYLEKGWGGSKFRLVEHKCLQYIGTNNVELTLTEQLQSAVALPQPSCSGQRPTDSHFFWVCASLHVGCVMMIRLHMTGVLSWPILEFGMIHCVVPW